VTAGVGARHKIGTRLALGHGMSRLVHWATRVALVVAAAGGVVAACYDDVPGPAGPLPPTREVKPLGPRPKPAAPRLVPKKPIVVEQQSEFLPAVPAHDGKDAGLAADVIDLPPVGDASGLDAPIVRK